jgi:hypothetical protein
MLSRRSRALATLTPLTLAAFGGPLATAADEASKPATAILADVARDFAKLRTFHFRTTQTDKDGRTRTSGDVDASGSVDMKVGYAGARWRFRVVGRQGFMKGNKAFWFGTAYDGPLPAELAELPGHWVKLSADSAVTKSMRSLTPARFVHCLVTVHGTLAKAGIEKQDGRRAIVLVDRGDKPGTAPGKLYVTATGPVLPLRSVQSGPLKSGGPRNNRRCNKGGEMISTSETRFSAFDQPLNIQAPRDYIDEEKLSN